MLTLMALGFLIGLQHALEADHIAAVSVIARNTASRTMAIVQGCAWGFGHTLALLALVTIVMRSGFSISNNMSHWMEFGVGIMLIFLGLRAISTAQKRRVHVHFHRHDDDRVHMHAHSHTPKAPTDHDQGHAVHLSRKTALPLFVGLVHGVAGSAALVILLTAMSLSTLWQVIGYVLAFGAGSILGMASMMLVFSVPVSWAQKKSAWGEFAFSMAIGLAVVGVGVLRCLSSAMA
ncbi:hypothetical protein QKW60_01550 [Defluviimonas aestuarii]|nr:hypothetical protein [Defluviimonas aestuarii]